MTTVAGNGNVGRAGGWLAAPVAAATTGCAGFALAPLTPMPGPVTAGSAGLVGVSVAAGVLSYRRDRRARLVDALHGGLSVVIGPVRATRLRARRWSGGFVGVPHQLVVWFDPQARSHDPKWLPQLLEICRSRTGVTYAGSINHRRSLVKLTAQESVQVATSSEHRRVERTIGELLGQTAAVTDLQSTDGQLSRIAASHQNGTRLALPGYRARVERTLSAVLPGRWRAQWDLHGDTVVFEQRPSFPAKIWLEPSEIDETEDVLASYDQVTIAYGVDEDGNVAYWRPAIDPNLMVVGSPGTGKTSLEHAILVQVSRHGWPIWVVDGKAVEFLGFRRDWPNVQVVATTIEKQVAVIERAWQVMEHRYQLITTGQAREEDFEPLMLFVDEFTDFKANLADWYAGVKQKGDPTRPPCLAKVNSLARKGRSSRVHLLFATQRPDAEYVGGETRDNFRARISMGRLSPQGAMMMWQDPSTGTTVPRSCRGRATTIDDNNQPIEIQTFYIPDPRKARDGEERARLEAVRPAMTRQERLIIMDPELERDLDDGDVLPAGYGAYANAPWVTAASRPDLDPANIQPGSAEAARELSSPMTVLEIDGRRRPASLGSVVDRTADSPDVSAEPEPQVDLLTGFGPAIDCPPDDLVVGDLVLHPDLQVWVTVDAPIEEDVTEPVNLSIFWRDDTDDSGHLSVPADEAVTARRPVIEED